MSADDDKTKVLGVLDREWQALDTLLRKLSDAQLDRPMFSEGPGWRVRDMPTHMAWWQELAARVAEKVKAEGTAPDDKGSRPYLGISTSPDELNAATFAEWRERPMIDRFDRWFAAHRRMMEAFRALSPDQLLQADGGIEGLKRYFAVPALVHLRMHREHVEEAVKETT